MKNFAWLFYEWLENKKALRLEIEAFEEWQRRPVHADPRILEKLTRALQEVQ